MRKRRPERPKGEKCSVDGVGDARTWAAIKAETKLIISHFVGGHDGECAAWFMDNVAAQVTNRIQPTSDDHKAATLCAVAQVAELNAPRDRREIRRRSYSDWRLWGPPPLGDDAASDAASTSCRPDGPND